MQLMALDPFVDRPPEAARSPLAAAQTRLADLAARLMHVPAALVSILDGAARRIDAVHGPEAAALNAELAPFLPMIDGSEEDFVTVADLHTDPRYAEVRREGGRLRFFAAVAIKTEDGVCRGHLCVLDDRPREVSPDERSTLVDVAASLGDQLALLPPSDDECSTLAARVKELSARNAALTEELRGRGNAPLERVRLERIIEESSDFIALSQLDGKTFYVNEAGRRLVGLDNAAEVNRTRMIDYLMREDRSFFLGTVMPTLMREGRWDGDLRFRNFKTGTAIEVSWNLFMIKDPRTDEPTGIATVTRDITGRKKTEGALRESEERFRHLVEQAGESFFVYDLTGRLIDVNQEACDSLGYPRAELLTMLIQEIQPEFDPVKGKDRWKQVVPGVAVTMTGANRRKNGTTFPVEARVGAFRSGGQRLMLALVRDMTDRKRAEEGFQLAREQLESSVRERTAELALANEDLRNALRENSRLAAAIESCQIGVLIKDATLPDAPTIFANNAFTNITGYSRAETIGRNSHFLRGNDTDPAMVEAIRAAIDARRSFRGTLLNYRKDGTPFWNEITINAVFDEVGRVTNFVEFQSDVTAQVKAQEALRQSELRFSRMTANVPGMVYQLLLHPDGTAEFPYVSEGCRELFRMEPAEMEADACSLLDLIHPDDIGGFLQSLNESRATKTAWAWEGRYAMEDGAERWLQGAARPEPKGESDTLWDGLLLDITTRKRAEREIRDRALQAAAVAELGQRALAGGDDSALVQEAADVITRTLGVELSIISELLPEDEGLVVRAGAGFNRDIAGIALGSGTSSLQGYAIATGGPLHVPDLPTETRFRVSPVLTEHGATSGLSVVIRGKNQPLGALCAASTHPRAYAPEDTSFLQAVANVLASAMDRSRDEQALRKSEARNSAILETALDSIVTIDHQDRIVEFNPAAEKTFGIARGEALGRLFSELMPPEALDGATLGQAVRALTVAQRPLLGERVELPAQRSDGTQILVEVAITRIPVEGLPLFTAHLRDITERKRTERALNQAKEEAETANRAKSEFLSRMSHELRTPLNAILGFGQLLQMQKLTPAQNDRVGHIVHAGRHLLDLINEVLDIARIEAGRVELSLEPVRMADLVSETLDLIKPLAAQRQIELATVNGAGPLGQRHVMADRQRLKQVLLNLLSNAVKYNAEGGNVRIEFADRDEDHLRVSITDSGNGIPAGKLERLFVPFDRLGAELSQVQGTGLGLALSKRLVEAMDGAIGVSSEPGSGATFWVELPRVESQVDRQTRLALSGPPTSMPTLNHAHTVLYIEDNLSNLTLIEHLLADHAEIKLMTAMQGRLGFDLARQHLPDLILLDLHLPDIPGWEVLELLRKEPTTRDIPVVAVSADATPRQIERLLSGGAQGYLTKPLDVDRFHEMLQQMLEPEVTLGK